MLSSGVIIALRLERVADPRLRVTVDGGFRFMDTLNDVLPRYLDAMRQKGFVPKTILEHLYLYNHVLRPALGDRPIETLTLADSFPLIERGKAHGIYGSQRAIVLLRRMLAFLQDSGIRPPFDWRDLRVPKVPQKRRVEYLEPDELERIRAQFPPTDLANLRTRAMIEVMLDTGMRIHEVCSLKKADVDDEKREAQVVNCKTKDTETVYFTDRSIEWLQRYWTARKDELLWAFVSGRAQMSPKTAQGYLRVKTRCLGIRKHIRPHIFRRTLVTTLLQNGVDVKTTQVIARHASARTTLRYYAGVSAERAKGEHQRVLASFARAGSMEEVCHPRSRTKSDGKWSRSSSPPACHSEELPDSLGVVSQLSIASTRITDLRCVRQSDINDVLDGVRQ